MDKSPAVQTIIYPEESAHYEKQFAAQPTVRTTGDPSSTPVQRAIPDAGKLVTKTSTSRAKWFTPDCRKHVSTSKPATQPALPHAQTWSQHQVGNHGQSGSHVQSGGHAQMGSHGLQDYESHRQDKNHPRPTS